MSSKKSGDASAAEEIFKKHQRFSSSMLISIDHISYIDPESGKKSGTSTGKTTDNEGDSTAHMSSKSTNKNALKRKHPKTIGTDSESSSNSRSSSSNSRSSSSSSSGSSESNSSKEEKKNHHKKLEPDAKRRHMNDEAAPLVTLPP